MRALLLLQIQIACTLAMTGIIWFVQIVHYPLFSLVGKEGFARYEAEHATRTGWVVGPLMCLELVTAAIMLSRQYRPQAITLRSAILGAALVALIWLSTGLIQVPLHNRLSLGVDSRVIATLVASNWIRTIAWTVRSALVLTWTATLLRPWP